MGCERRSRGFGDCAIQGSSEPPQNPGRFTAREFDVLAYLMARPNVVISREELLREIWGSSAEWQDPATVTEHVRRLRRKLEPNPDEPAWLETVRGVGYRYRP